MTPPRRIFPDLRPKSRRLAVMPAPDFLVYSLIGVLSGLVGGLLGIGGSTIFIPAATLIHGPDQQVYQAAAMILNAVVATTATIKHHRNGMLERPLLIKMMIPATILVLIGVAIGNHLGGEILARLFGILLLILAVSEAKSLIGRRRTTKTNTPGEEPDQRAAPWVLMPIGGLMGFLGGLLGIGGGTVGVPMLRFFGRLPLRKAIANTAAVTIPLALIGGIYKNISLSSLPEFTDSRSGQALWIALALIPGAILGSWMGASLVHRLPLVAIRIAFLGLLVFVGTRMVGLH